LKVRALLRSGVMALLAALPAAAQAADPGLLNKVVIRINDRIATLHDYETRRVEMERELLRSDLPLAERRRLAGQVPERVFADLYQEILLLSRADQLGVVLTDEQLEAQLGRLQESYGFADRAEFEAALEQSGLSMREFREQLRRNMRIQDVIGQEVRSQISVDDDLARKYYREHKDRFELPRRMTLREIIVLDAGPLSAEERREIAATVRARVAAGEKLAEVIAPYHEAGTTSGVIELGQVTAGDLAPELEAAVWELEAGQATEPVASRGGLHVIEVVERQEAGLQPFNDVAEQALRMASEEAYQDRMSEYLQELDARAYVQLDPPPGAEGFRRAEPGEALEPMASETPPDAAAPEPEPPPPAGG